MFTHGTANRPLFRFELTSSSSSPSRYEDDQALLRALRIILRDVTSRLLAQRRWEVYTEPIDQGEDPDFYQALAAAGIEPMDLATLLWRVDHRRYYTPEQYLADVATIPAGERAFWGEPPPAQGVRAISRACALEDAARTAVGAAVPAELAAKLTAMEAAGGPAGMPAAMQAAATAARQAAAARGAVAAAATAAGVVDGEHRRATRHGGGAATVAADTAALHADPEAEARRIRLAKKAQEAQLRKLQEEAEAAVATTDQPSAAEIDDVARASPVLHGEAAEVAVAPVMTAMGAMQEEEQAPLSPEMAARAEAMTTKLTELTGGLVVEELEGVRVLLARTALEAAVRQDRGAVLQEAEAAVEGWLAGGRR
jgi:hypothetical protein